MTLKTKIEMEPQSIPISNVSALDLLRTAFARLSSLGLSHVWRRRARGLRVCETLSLGNRGYLAVVSYRRQEFLVGGTTNSIALLAQLSTSPAADQKNAEDDDPAR
ncbi:MAG: flagellar biosynthetic protein FliO [Candidatus Acidiferrales bacterium]